MIATAELTSATIARPAILPGTGALRVSRGKSRSHVSRAFAVSPLRVLTPLNHGRAAWIYTSTFGGGLLDGDSIRINVEIDAGAYAYLSTQASTKIYRGAASSELDATVGDASVLVAAPDPVVCFAKSAYRQVQRFNLVGSAALVLVDWFTAGRRAMGERWAFDRYASRTEVRRDGRLVWYDALLLDAGDDRIDARVGRFDVLCAIAMIGAPLEAHAEALAAQIARQPVEPAAALITSASRIDTTGCLVRIAGPSVETVGVMMRTYLACVPHLLGDDPWTRRW